MGRGGFQCLGELKDGAEGRLSEAAFELGDEGSVQAAHAESVLKFRSLPGGKLSDGKEPVPGGIVLDSPVCFNQSLFFI
jgi:hypothetical protein